MFASAGLGAAVAGNIGRPLTELVGELDPGAWIVCELSSFQLEDTSSLRPRIAVLTNLEPDHLDRHGGFDAYAAAKLRIFAHQGPDDVAIVPRGFRPVPGRARRVEFAADRRAPGRAPAAGRAQPRERRGSDAPPPAQQGCRRRRSPRPCGRSRVSSTGSRSSRRSAASATSTTRRRRTSPQRCAPSPRSRAPASS